MGTRRWSRSVGKGRRRGAGGRRTGFSLVELLVASTLIVVALTGIAGSMLSTMALNRANRETALAQQAACRALEELRSVPFGEIFYVYNANAGDNPFLTPERGPNFAAPGLSAVAADADGLVGQILFPTVVVAGDEELHENVADEALGMPRELGDPVGIDNEDHADDYQLLPVRVRLEWQGVNGRRELVMETMLCAR